VVKPYNLEKSKAFIISFISVIIKLHLKTL